MGLKDGLTQLGVLAAIFGGMGYVILMKINRNNPKAAKWLNKFKLGKVYDKTEAIPGIDRIEQVYDEKRTMM